VDELLDVELLLSVSVAIIEILCQKIADTVPEIEKGW